MIEVLIVDDEYMIRDGLRTLINWEKLGYKVIGTAENGQKALDFYQRHRPKVILADIKMPFMNGLELLANIKKRHKDCYFIILTGYDDFKYAKKSIDLGVFTYLLKPVEPKELENALKNIREDIDQKAQALKGLSQFVGNITNNSFIEIQSFLSNIVTGSTSVNSNVIKKYALNNMFFSLAIVYYDKNSPFSVIDILASVYQEKYNNKVFWVKYFHNSILITSIGSTFDESKRRLAEFVGNIISSPAPTIIVGKTVENVSGIIKSFNSAVLKFNQQCSKQLYHISDTKAYGLLYAHSVQSKNKIISGFMSMKKADVVEGSNLLFQTLIKSSGKDYIIRILSKILFAVLRNADEFGVNLSELFNNPLQFSRIIFDHNDLYKMFDQFNSTIEKIFGYLMLKKDGRNTEIIEKAEKYIQKNLNDSTLSLTKVAYYIGLSPCYFSTLFKKEKGIRFIEFLINLRIQTAIMLLTTKKYNASEVSYMVGYSNYNCFSTIFKKYTGFAPTQFNKQ